MVKVLAAVAGKRFVIALTLGAFAFSTGAAVEPSAGDAADAGDAPAVAAAPEGGALAHVAGLCDDLHGVLEQSNDIGYEQRYALLAPILAASFDLEYMARQAVGRGFLDLDEGKRQLWYDLFAQYMVSNYAARFDHYSEQRFEVLGDEPGARDTVLVSTRIVDPAQENVDMGYRLRQTVGGWRVIDVYLKGTVSELALRRSEYSAVLKREGFDSLVAKVREKIEAAGKGGEVAASQPS